MNDVNNRNGVGPVWQWVGSKMAVERFQTLSEQEMAELLTEKDSKNTQLKQLKDAEFYLTNI